MVRLSKLLFNFAEKVPKVTFHNGQTCPVLGFGTWQAKKNVVGEAVKEAITAGYRHIDCALIYRNETEVGEAIKAKIEDGTVKREDLYIVSKLWNTMHRPDLVEPALKTSLTNLCLDYLDLYLIHWPFAFKEDGDLFPIDNNRKLALSNADYVDTWKEMEKLNRKGLTKSIGVSNFNWKQLERLNRVSAVKPVTNQIEIHPYLPQTRLVEFCKSYKMVVTAYSPLGAPARPGVKPSDPVIMDDPIIKGIAQKHNKSAPQVLIRYGIQRGCIVLVKSVTKERIAHNIDVWDFQISDEDMEVLNSLDCNYRTMPFIDAIGHKDYPFREEW
ncbi:aldo-keto reductase family 1 member B7-like [Cylas formicarius]|uniref:aldo-keto reductase family 1 member B7-like n=1 Tax=Cylas formicarius TaxID=197179 RepID=UPI002958AA78|nr:aldo-keto reductase family 1 member B7-like [Cylas formicarius]